MDYFESKTKLKIGTVLLKEFERDFNMKKDLDAVTKLSPEIRYTRCRQFLDNLKNQSEARAELSKWEIEFSPDVMKVNASVLPPNTVQFKSTSISNTERGWNNSMKNAHHLNAIPLKKWALCFMPRDEEKAYSLSDELQSISSAMDFYIDKANMIRLPNARGSAGQLFAAAIKESILDMNPQMIVCIVPNTAKDVYDAIKRTCCNEYGIPSQVVTSNIINMNNMIKTKSVVTKVAIQMNCKLGGEIWGVTIPVIL